MSYDLAVWEGPQPHDDAAALAEYERRFDESEETEATPSPVISAFVATLDAQYPESAGIENSPWMLLPLIENANGTFLYLPINYGRAESVRESVADLAQRYNLVCVDLQEETLLTGSRASRG